LSSYVFFLQPSQSRFLSNRWRYGLHGFDMYILSFGRIFFQQGFLSNVKYQVVANTLFFTKTCCFKMGK